MTHPTDAGPAPKPSDEARRLVGASQHDKQMALLSAWTRADLIEAAEYPGVKEIIQELEKIGYTVARLEATPQNAGEAKPVAWEYFRDESYYDLWAVRPKSDTSFNSPKLFHVWSERDAINLCAALAAPPHADLVAEIERLRAALETAARRLDHADFCMSAQEARAALTNGGKNARSDAGEAGE